MCNTYFKYVNNLQIRRTAKYLCGVSVAQNYEASFEAYFEALQELDQMEGIELSSLISLSPSLGVMGLLM